MQQSSVGRWSITWEEEPTMEYRTLGSSGIKVAPICLGTMQFGWTADEPASHRILDAYADAGGNFIDTADVYSSWAPGNPGGVSEEIIGRWLKQRGNRRAYVVATKVQGRMWDGPNGDGLSRAHIMQAVEDSLRRLQTDYIDLYQTHWPRYDTPQEETMRALDDLVRDGKVRYIGCSNEPAWRLTKSLWISDREHLNRFVSLQPPYSLVNRAGFERENEALCLDQGIGVIPYSPLQGGFLTGKYRRDTSPESVRAEGLKKYMTERNYALIDLLEQLGQAHDATVTQMSLAWMLRRPAITAPIIGANSVEQLDDILGTLNVQLSPDEAQQIDAASDWKGNE
jgi:aryl-alcohol dehydrogenase-like predicted oxidoreductase